MLKRINNKFASANEIDDIYMPMEEELAAPNKSEK